MKIICLSENTAGSSGCDTEHGLSLYIETDVHTILMDTGASGLFIRNAERLGADLSKVDTAVISHGHYDHGGGLPYFLKINDKAKIYAMESAFGAYYSVREEGLAYIGLAKELRDEERIIRVIGDVVIDPQVSLFSGIGTGENVPSANSRLKKKTDEGYVQDDFSHEQCLVITENGRRFLFSGCAHHGILNILKRFEEIYGCLPDGVVSGFHMMKKSGYTEEDIQQITGTAKKLIAGNTWFLTCHCTGEFPYEIMKKIMGERLDYIHCGDEITVNTGREKD